MKSKINQKTNSYIHSYSLLPFLLVAFTTVVIKSITPFQKL